MQQPFFTFFTSVYNRKHTIHRVWESLKNQTNKNFEWILIDNGSQDDIKPLLEKFKEEADFKVRTFYQENMGKFMAFNRAVDLAEGELFIPADSDDSFEPNTVEFFSDLWLKNKSDNISGINVLCKLEDGSIFGDKYPKEGLTSYTDIFFKHKLKGEKWGCIRVDLLKKYKFPEVTNTKILPDTYVWAKIGFNYDLICANVALRTYYIDAGNQLTKDKSARRTPEYMKMKNDYTIWQINYMFPRVSKYLSPLQHMNTYFHLWKTSFRSNTSFKTVLSKLERGSSKFLAVISYIPSLILSKFR